MNFKRGNFDALKRYKSTEVDRRTWLFNFVFMECFVICYIKRHYNLINIKEDMAFENVDYAISRKLEVRF